MKYSIILPLLSLASTVIAAPAVVTQTSVVLVTAGNGQVESSTTSPSPSPTPSSSASPKVGHVYEVVVSELIEVSGTDTKTSTTTSTKTLDPTATGPTSNAAAPSSSSSEVETLSHADRAVVSTIGEASSAPATSAAPSSTEASTSQETTTSQAPPPPPPTSSSTSTKPTTTLTPSSSSTEQQPSTSSTSTSTSTSSTSSGSEPSSSFASEILKVHNEKRSESGASALSWSDKLAKYAQDYADQYDCSGTLTHSGGPYGENLGLGYSTSGVVDAWYNEKSYYNPNSPAASHFTQVVWKSTTELGCGYKQCGSYWGQYTVCSYNPAGNVAGEYKQNVQV